MEEIGLEYITLARQAAMAATTTGVGLSKAFDFYMMAFDKCADLTRTHEPEFRTVISRLNEIMEATNKMEDIFKNFCRTLEFFPNHIYFINDMGKYLFRYAFYNEAWFHFQKALSLDATCVDPEKNLNSVKNLLVERWHFRMLNDRIRNEAYRAAISQTIVPVKDSVLDVGTGTGLLSLYASDCKPLAITACESSKVMARLADIITQEHNRTVIIVNDLSTRLNYLDIGGKRSLLITEMFDAGLFGEHVLQTLTHAWEYLLNNVGRVLPGKAEFFVIGAKSDFLCWRYQLRSSIKTLLNIPTLNVHVLTYDETYDCEDVHHFGDDLKYMTEPKSVIPIDFNNALEMQDALKRTEPYEVELNVKEDGEINVYIGWFNLYLTDEVSITTDPRSDVRANAWQQAVFFDNIPKQVKENDIVNAKFLINGGKLTMLPEQNCEISRISPETLMFLNDVEFVKMISGCIGMASIYLGQMTEMSQVNVIDLCPFPMFGLQLLKRGIQSLICYAKTESDERFFKAVFEANDISLSKVTILTGENWAEYAFREDKYHAIFCNILELCGEIDLHFKEIAETLRQNHLVQGGLYLPSNIKMMGQIVHSHWLDINNRVYNENVSNFRIGHYLTKFEVTQNFCIDFSHLEYTPLSEPTVLGNYGSSHGTEMVNVPIIRDGNVSAILCWYVIELMDNMNEIATNRKNSFIDGLAFIIKNKVLLRSGESKNIMRCVDPDGAFKLILRK